VCTPNGVCKPRPAVRPPLALPLVNDDMPLLSLRVAVDDDVLVPANVLDDILFAVLLVVLLLLPLPLL
jgi:hypothetical protein